MGKLELRIPRDAEGRFLNRALRTLLTVGEAPGLKLSPRCVQGVSPCKVKAITEELLRP